MQNVESDHMAYEEYRMKMASEIKESFEDLRKEAQRKIQGILVNDQAEEIRYLLVGTFHKSVKPGEKVPYKPKKYEMDKKALRALAVGVAALVAVAGVKVSPNVLNMVKNVSTNVSSQILQEEMADFSQSSVMENANHSYTFDDMGTPYSTGSYNYSAIFMDAKNRSANPLVALYILKKSVGEQEINSRMDNFNRIFGTDYESIEDCLYKNNLTEKEWKSYVAMELANEEEVSLDGNSSVGR